MRSVEILNPRVERSDELGRGLAAVVGQRLTGVHRLGKSVEVTCDDATVLRVRFGMSGRMVMDGRSAISDLLYGPNNTRTIWDRARLDTDRGAIAFNDPRRFGAIEVNPAPLVLGPDDHVDSRAGTLLAQLAGADRSSRCCSIRASSPASATSPPTRSCGGSDSTRRQTTGNLGERAGVGWPTQAREVMAMLPRARWLAPR